MLICSVSVASGIFLYYLVMPLAVWVLAHAFNISPELLVGIVSAGIVTSGTSSNVMIYLFKGHMALPVTIAFISKLIRAFTTLLLTWLYVDIAISVDVMKYFSAS